MQDAASIGRTPASRCLVLCAGASFACLPWLSGCGDASSNKYHESPHVGKNADSLQPTTPEVVTTEQKTEPQPTGNPKSAATPTPETAKSPTPAVDAKAETKAAGKTQQVQTPTAPSATENPKASTPIAVGPRPSPKGVNPAGAGQLSIDTSSSGPPRKPEVLVKERKFKVEGPEAAVRVSYDDIDLLKVLNMEPVTPEALTLMPDWMKSLDGKRIRLRGFMFPPYQETGLTGFAFARDNEVCCFVRKPKIYDVFEVRMRDGQTTDYIQGRPFDVVGVFHLIKEHDEWDIRGMYRIDDARVIDK